MGYDAATAGSVYGLYTFGVYALALPGGWIADRLIGQRRAVLYGGVLIALGHYSLAVPSTATFYLGLVLIVFGTGLLKPNISAIVGDLYTEKGAQRDAGVFDLLHGHQRRSVLRARSSARGSASLERAPRGSTGTTGSGRRVWA